MIPHSRPTIEDDDIKAVTEVMKSLQIAIGPKTREFEEKMSSFIGVHGTLATSSGTTALHLALTCLGVDKGDEVILPTGVCASVMNSIYYCGASPVIVDIEPDNFNMSTVDVKRKITNKTKAIIVPHMYGSPVDMDPLKGFGIPLIEDCAHSIGAFYKSKKVGGIGDAAIFSFYATKMITTGEGGMVTFKSKNALERARDLREYNYKQDYKLRYNYKMTDMQAAMGMTQLAKLPRFIKKRRELARAYNEEFGELPVVLPKSDEKVFYRYIISLEKPNVIEIVKKLEKHGISSICPISPLHRYLRIKGVKNAEMLMETALSIPIYPTLTEHEFDSVVKAVKAEVK